MRRGQERRGKAGQGRAGHGKAWLGKARVIWQDRYNAARQGEAGQGEERQGKARRGQFFLAQRKDRRMMLVRHYPDDKYRTLCCLPIGTCEITIISTLVTCDQCKEMLKKKGIPIKDDYQDCACGRPAKYIYQPMNVAGDPLCGIHAWRFKDSESLRPINVKLNSK